MPSSIYQSLISIFQEEQGSSLVEFALTVPVLLLILMAIFDMGQAVYTQNVMTHAVREGVRYGAVCYTVDPPCSCQQIADKAEGASFGLALDANAAVNSNDPQYPSCGSPSPSQPINTVQVTATYTFTAVTPLIGNYLGPGGAVELTAASTMDVEGLQ